MQEKELEGGSKVIDPSSCIERDCSDEREGEQSIELPPFLEGGELTLLQVDREKLRSAQMECSTLKEIQEMLDETQPGKTVGEFVKVGGLLFRSAKDHYGNERRQLVIPASLRERVKALCHEDTGAHLGVTKTKDKILRYFFWPSCFKDIESYVRSCDLCQRAGKSGDKKKAPLKLVPVIKEVFSKLNVDACGPLQISTNGNRYLITVICMASRYPDAIPVTNLTSVVVTDALLNIFSRTGFPREVQCDNGTYFTSNLTTEFFGRFGIKVTHSSVSHPQSNPVERLHLSLKRLLRVLCLEAGPDWEKHLPAALFALRTVRHEGLGYSPAELVHGKNFRTPETLLYEHWVEPEGEDLPVTEYVFELINRLKQCQEFAVKNLERTQEKRKLWYDKRAVKREFKKGDLVMIFAVARAHKLSPQWLGPGTVESKVSETNYVVKVPERGHRSQVYHVNMLKPYYQRPEMLNLLVSVEEEEMNMEQELEVPEIRSDPNIYAFEDVTRDSKLGERLTLPEITQLETLLNKHLKVFSNEPGMTDLVEHDIDLIDERPVRSKAYRTSPRRTEILKREIQKMLDMGVIEVGESDYTSPMILVETPGRDHRPCIDYRKLNQIIRTEFFPLPNIEERVERVASAKYITILDLAKGYWQIPLTPKAQRLAAFVTSFGSYRPLRMAFGLKNAPYFFSKLMAVILRGCEDFAVPYLDDIAIFSTDWKSHLQHLDDVLRRISNAKLTIKPSKCKFAQDHVQYLGHVVGNGYRTPAEAKTKAIFDFPRPQTKTQLRAFMGLSGYYAHYVDSYSLIAAPLTDALKGKAKKGSIGWSPQCEEAFQELKRRLTTKPILYAPNYSKEFLIQCDSSDKGMGVVLAQCEGNSEHPILFLSKKFNPAQLNYSVSEKECACIIFAVKKLHHYLDGQAFTIITDHNPLVWLDRNASSNPRLLRWALALQPYNYVVKHRAGREHQNADALSRAEIE